MQKMYIKLSVIEKRRPKQEQRAIINKQTCTIEPGKLIIRIIIISK